MILIPHLQLLHEPDTSQTHAQWKAELLPVILADFTVTCDTCVLCLSLLDVLQGDEFLIYLMAHLEKTFHDTSCDAGR